jgi:HK97 gp10 family phage protein
MAKMENRDRLLKKLARIQGAPRKRLREALEQNASELTAMQKRFVPTRTGALAASIRYTFGYYKADNPNVRGFGGGGGGDPDLSVTIHAGSATAWYAGIVEFGTQNARLVKNYFGHRGVQVNVGSMPAQPFFFPPYRALKKRMKSRATRAARKGIKEAIGS